LLEIKPKSTRSASPRADEAKTMLHVDYKVDERKERGTCGILVNSILFETKGGNHIQFLWGKITILWGIEKQL
jgi:hypothetical protein